MGFPGGSVVKNPPANAGDTGSIPGSEKFPGRGNGSTLQYSCLGSLMDRGSRWTTVHGSELGIIIFATEQQQQNLISKECICAFFPTLNFGGFLWTVWEQTCGFSSSADFSTPYVISTAFLVAQMVICLQCKRPRFDSWVGKIPWSGKWQPTPVFLPGESHGQRSLAGYRTCGHKESDTT